MSSLAKPSTTSPVEEIVVETITLDEYCLNKKINQIDVIKIDVEGAEMQLFKGAQGILTSVRPLIICEVLDLVTGPWAYPAREIMTYINKFGYDWFDIIADGRIMPHKQQTVYPEVKNYLAVPREKRAGIKNLIVEH